MRAPWLSPLLLYAGALATPAGAAEPTFGPLPVSTTALTLHNASDAGGAATVTLRDPSGVVGSWSQRIPGHGAVTLELAAITSGQDPVSVTVSSAFSGYVRPLTLDAASGVITDRAPCVTDSAAALHAAAGVTALTRLRFESLGPAVQTPVVGVFDAASGDFLGAWTGPAVGPGAPAVASGADIMRALNLTGGAFTLTVDPAFVGRLVHLEVNAAGAFDLTAKCAIGPDPKPARDAVLAPAIEKAADVLLPGANDALSFVLQGSKWGDPTLRTAATVPWSFFDPANGPSFIQGSGFPYVDGALPARNKALIRQAAHLWEQVANIHYAETSDAASKLRVGTGYLGSIETAVGSFPCDACTGAGRDIVSFNREVFGGARHAESYLLDIAAHEFGHTVGLNHDLVRSSVMGFAQRSLSPVQLKGLTEDDIAGAQALYGVNADPQKVIEDDVEGDEFTDTVLTPAATFDGHIETPADEDWFVVNLVPGNDYYFTAAPLQIAGTQAGGLSAPRVELRTVEYSMCCNWSSPLLSNTAVNGGTAGVAITPQYPGYYWLVVKGANETVTGGYRVTMLENAHPAQISFSYAEGGSDFPATLDTPGHLSLYNGFSNDASATLIGQMNTAGDADWYRFEAEAGRAYVFTVTGGFGFAVQSQLAHPRLILRDETGAELARDDASGVNGTPRIAYTATAARNLILDVRATDSSVGGYALSVVATPIGGTTLSEGTDLPGNLSSTAAIYAGQSFTGTIDRPGDSDWIRFKAVQNHIYAVTLRGADSGGGTLTDPVLRLRGPEGQVYGVRDDTAGTHDGALYLQQTYDQDMWLDMSGFGRATGTYTLDVTELPRAINPAANYTPDTAGLAGDVNFSVPLNGSTPGAVSPGSGGNGFRVFLTGGHTYRLAVPARDPANGALADLTLQLRDPYGNRIAQATSAGGARTEFSLMAPMTGGYTAQVVPLNLDAAGNYQVELSLDSQANAADPDTTDAAFDTLYFKTGPTLSPTAASLTARLETRDDRDVILVATPANTWYRVTASVPAGSTASLAPELYTPSTESVNGYQLALRADGKLDTSSMYVRNASDAPFKIVVHNDRDAGPFGDGRYTLTLTREDPH